MRFIAQTLCLLLAWSTMFPAYAAIPVKVKLSAQDIATLQQRYPHARVIHISPAQYPTLQKDLLREGMQPVAQYWIAQNSPTTTPAPVASPPTDTHAAPASAADLDCKQYKSEGDEFRSSFKKTMHTTAAMEPDHLYGGADIVGFVQGMVLIVIGFAVVAVWGFFAVDELVKFFMYPEPCDGSWSELRATSSSMLAGTNQYGHFNGVRYMKGFDEGWADVGISAEMGDADILLSEATWIRMQGLYWFIGPMLRWDINPGGTPDYFQLQFVVGSTENPQMGVIAQAKAGVDFGIGQHFRWGLDFGLVNIQLHNNQGIITNLNQSYPIYGLNVGYRF